MSRVTEITPPISPLNKKVGRPRFVPTDEQRKIVEKAAGFGLPQDKICQLIISKRTGKPIDKKTLAEAFRAELDRGMASADYEVANALFSNALSGNVAAQIWWTKARMGWSETIIQKDSDEAEFDRMTEEELIKALEEQANSLGIHIKLSYDFPGAGESPVSSEDA
jgi:hypothetical protein